MSPHEATLVCLDTPASPLPMHQAPVLSLAIASGKGGVGKTSIAVNLAVALSRINRSTLLMDTDLGLANVDVMLGLRPHCNLSDVLSGRRSIHETILPGPEGLHVLPASSGRGHMAELSRGEHMGLIHAVSGLSLPISTLLVDNAAGIADGVLTFCQAANEVLVVICDDPASITDAYALIKLLSQERHVRRFHVVVNLMASELQGQEVFKRLLAVTDRFLNVGLHYLGTVPHDPFMVLAVKCQRPVVTAHPYAASSLAIKSLAKRITRWSPPAEPSGGPEFFVERLLPCKVVG